MANTPQPQLIQPTASTTLSKGDVDNKHSYPRTIDIGGEIFITLPGPKVVSIYIVSNICWFHQLRLTEIRRPQSLVTVIPVFRQHAPVEEHWLKNFIAKYETCDDVFSNKFLNGVIFIAPSSLEVTPEARRLLEFKGNSWIEILKIKETEVLLPSGPHIIFEQDVFEIRRLYEDSQGAFVTSIVPGSSG